MPALPDHTKQICRTNTGGCMCDPEYHRDCERLKPGKSIGHMFFVDDTEYFQFENSIFQVPKSAHMHTNGTLKGIRVGARFYCTRAAWTTSPMYRCYPELRALDNFNAGKSDAAPVPTYERGD